MIKRSELPGAFAGTRRETSTVLIPGANNLQDG